MEVWQRDPCAFFISTEGVGDRPRPKTHRDFMHHLRNALVHTGLTREEAARYAGHAMRSGAAAAAASELPPRLPPLAAGAKDAN